VLIGGFTVFGWGIIGGGAYWRGALIGGFVVIDYM
jgi:hypothetical protein